MGNPQPLYEKGDTVSKAQLAEAVATFHALLGTYQGHVTRDMKQARDILSRKWFRYSIDLKKDARGEHFRIYGYRNADTHI